MNRRLTLLPALALLSALLCGCSEAVEPTTVPAGTEETAAATQATEYTCPPDGDGADVTCKGSYSAVAGTDLTVATVGETELTNAQLRAWYWLEVGNYLASGAQPLPDMDIPLDCQGCPVDDTVSTWQQYFLKRALERWHGAQALALQAQQEGVPLEKAYQPNETYHAQNLQNIPAVRFLYGQGDSYQPNTLHQAYLDEIPALLEALAAELGFTDGGDLARSAAGTVSSCLAEAVTLYNLSYMYLTTLSYEITSTDQEIRGFMAENPEKFPENGTYVDMRHILLTPEQTDADWAACREAAEALLKEWKRGKSTEAGFAELANRHSQDPGSAPSGGAYYNLTEGQLCEALDTWCFDPARKRGDTGVIRSEAGYHVVYFARSVEAGYAEAKAALTAEKQAALITAAREKYPMTVDYSAITLANARARLGWDDVLYPDVAHERFPEVPLYLQQDYPRTMYGSYPVATHGCGITSMAMLASYLTDDEQTVPEMCDRFGKYCLESGTNYMLFINEPAGMGFFLRAFIKSGAEAKAALEEGYIVVSLQHQGYWTRGGHFIVIEEITEDGLVRVRDSNLYNYGKLKAHEQDLHEWSSVTYRSAGYWVYEKKVTSVASCARCGDAEPVEGILAEDYICHKCSPALIRRDTYLNYGA